MRFFRFLISRHPVISVLLAVSVAGLVWFGVGVVREAIYFAQPEHQQQDLEPWMSPRFVGKSWDLPPPTIVRIMELEPDQAQPTLRQVTAHLGISLGELQDRVETAKAEQLRRMRGPAPREDREAEEPSGDKPSGGA